MSEPPPQRTIDEMRPLFDAAWVATGVAFVVLYFFPERTAAIFAWTIDPPLTAAFLGAGYSAGVVLVAGSRRQRVWAKVRLGYMSVMVFSTLALVATVIHADRFHFTEGGAAGFAAWAWLFVYLAVPTAMFFLLFRQRTEPGDDPPQSNRMPMLVASVLGVAGATLIIWGLALFAVPTPTARTWPWPLTPLSARMIAAWLIAIGATAVLAIRERDLALLRTPCGAMLAYGVFGLLAVLIRRDELTGSVPGAFVLLAAIGALSIVSAAVLRRTVRIEIGR
jgi:hypothetical protein